MDKILRLLALLLIISSPALAQSLRISGIAADSTDNNALIGVSVLLMNANDSSQVGGTITDSDGKFTFSPVKPGQYLARLTYVGYGTRTLAITVKDAPVDLGYVTLSPGVTTLGTLEITAPPIAVEQKGDTTLYNADAYKTNPDATAEDLINKMPGITSDSEGVKAQGETVRQVLVDGKEFFGNDAAIALKNLPAEIIERIEVFDRLSEQSQFTGFDDGNTQRTLNIVTKSGKNQGQFGRVYGGLGEGGLYTAGGNINSFKGDTRISVVGLANNINQQNFSSEDLQGMTSSGGGGRGGRGGGGGGNFNMGQQSGISTTQSIGLNYSDQWGEKTQVTGSYFYNQSDNERITDRTRYYITPRDSGLVYREARRSDAMNFNHRLNFRIEREIDSQNSIIFTPRLSFQDSESLSLLNGDYSGQSDQLRRQLDDRNSSENNSFNFSSNLVYRRRFEKRGRTFSIGVNTDISNRDGIMDQMSLNEDQNTGELTTVDQHTDNYTKTLTVTPNIAFTEPLGQFSRLQLNYTPSWRLSSTDKRTRNLDPDTEEYTSLDTLLSNTFDNLYITQRGGLSYMFNNRKVMVNTGLNVQRSTLESDREFPRPFSVNRSFQNILPQVMTTVRFSNSENLRFNYRTSTNAPSVNQLQDVVDNSNPLFLRTGNPDLEQTYGHNLSLRYSKSNIEKSTTFLLMGTAGMVSHYITNTSIIASADTTVNGIDLAQGMQLSYPVNIDGYRTASALLTYGFPMMPIRSNLNLNTEVRYNRIPALINGAKNLANNYTFGQGIAASGNFSENFDITASYNASYTVVKNTLQTRSDNNYFRHTASLRLTWLFKGFVFNSNVNHSQYHGLGNDLDRSIWFWNAGLGYKFLKDKSLEVKFNAFDLLNRNNSITRDISETYIEDRETNVLNRYFMVTATYSLRRFGK